LTRLVQGADELQAAYAKYLDDQWIRFAIASASIANTLVPIFAILDFLVYPAWFHSFLWLRIGCAAIVGVAVAIAVRFGRAVTKPVTIGGFILIQIMICYMIMVTEGARSGYYAGLNLPIITMGFFLPTVLLETVLFCSFSLALYWTACVLAGDFALSARFLENVFFLVSTSVIASFSTWYLGIRRQKEFHLSFELERRNRDLASLNQQRTDFFSNISHELRTPLTLILAPVQELLQRGQALPDALATRLGVVRDNAFRLLKLVNELLDLIRLEEGQESLDTIPLDLNRLLSGLLDGMVHLADAKGVQLDRELSAGHLLVRGDARAMEKVFVNLLSNAIKFTGSGGRVRVETRCHGREAVVQVSDTGIGIRREDQELVFQRFRQGDASTTRRYRGTGLGLALVKEMTARMGGSVGLLSEVGRGTQMSVRFPLIEEGEGTMLPGEVDGGDAIEELHRMADRRGGLVIEAPSDSDPWEPQGRVSNYPTVLVVEDEPDMRRYLTEVLSGDYQVMQARDGREGLRLALEREPDLIVLDLMLPEMDGLEVCRRIRSDAKPRPSRIMLLTARADEQSKLTALENGANDFLTKPFSTVEVLTRLRNLLENARLERDLAVRNARLEQTLKDLEATQAQLIQSEKLNALGSLSAGLLHEINNPLNYSLTALQLLGSDPTIRGDELMREIVGDIQEGMDRIRTIVSDLRAFAYPTEAEKQCAFDLNEAVEAALRFTAHDLKGIDVIQELPAPAMVEGSKSHLTQVLINLLANAAKAIGALTEARSGTIHIDGEERDGRLWVRVSDNGVGMDDTTLGRIFDPFFTTRDVGEGMGLGLSICHTIVTNHQGRLTATSRPGEGTELTFDLAVADGIPLRQDFAHHAAWS
jgi:signal transduction histidine kinase